MAPEVKLLAEWFWTDRWMGSSAFLLPIGPRGLYREMLTQAWRRGARLPNNHETIRRAVGCTMQEWNRCWPSVQGYWRVDGDSLVNDTQVEVYTEALGIQQRASARGKKGAQARAQAAAQALTQVEPEPPLKIQPPSPSPTEDQKQQIKSTGAARRPVHKPVEISEGTHGFYCVIAEEALDLSIRQDNTDSLGNVAEIFKRLCAQRKVSYDGDVQTKAINAVLVAHEKRAKAS